MTARRLTYALQCLPLCNLRLASPKPVAELNSAMYTRLILLFALLLTLSACAGTPDSSTTPNLAGPSGSELARPTAQQAGLTGH